MTARLVNPEIPRESTDWVETVFSETDEDGNVTTVAAGRVELAVLQSDTPTELRPGEDDWAEPVPDPHGGPEYGVSVEPVEAPAVYGVWARVDGEHVIEPGDVGYIIRT